ncbi:hypothetical protein W97_07750 [Coniosporium apollinis CBS 100218]|uniref:Uncharacterized protein n=1 Tax=Coniosporium apollinis (strain CBS 100218) TaxID=1168221 RepID=R7Z3B0_CONA1|nr:uncharacterized protein W97_07750 [Coniosporium apollinis CBS 100218]EON68426.1 hypothetical protein W97_07750 [Coniosporium apollinis CBS 100218]
MSTGAIKELVEAAGKEGSAEGVALGGEVGEAAMNEARLLEEVKQLAIKETPESLAKSAEADVAASLEEGSEMVMAEAKAGGTFASLRKKLTQLGKYMWDNKSAFAKLMGAEVAKGAFFTLGMIAVEKIFAAKQQKNETPEGQYRLDIVRAINKERAITNPIIKEWRTWLADHFDDRAQFGTLNVEGDDVQRFQLLQNKISTAQHFLDDTVAKASETLKTVNDKESAKDLLTQEIGWVNKLKAISDSIKSRESMVAAGLKDNGDQIDKAKTLLDDVNK